MYRFQSSSLPLLLTRDGCLPCLANPERNGLAGDCGRLPGDIGTGEVVRWGCSAEAARLREWLRVSRYAAVELVAPVWTCIGAGELERERKNLLPELKMELEWETARRWLLSPEWTDGE